MEGRPSFPAVIDNTMRGTFVSCPRKFMYGFVKDLKPARKSIHLHAGGCFAKGIETYRLSFYRDKMNEEQALNRAFKAVIKEWGSDIDPEDHETKTLWNILLAVEYYFEQWPAATDFLQPYFLEPGKPAIECTFALPIPGITHPETGGPIMYCGRYDMLGTFQGQLFVNDEKTTSQLGGYWPLQWDLSSQLTGYCWAARQYGFPVAGALIRGLGILKREFKNAMVPQYRSDWEIDRWLEQLRRDINRMIECWKEGYWDYNLGEACNAYGSCAYNKLCLAQNYQDWLEGNYRVEKWDPLRKIPE